MTITGNAIATRGGELAAQPATALAIRPGQDMWNDKQRAALSVLGIKDASNADLAVYMHVCQRTGLDPFTRQIYMLNRREKQGEQWVTKQTIQVGIDGFRVIRDRAAAKLGVDVEYEDTRWYDSSGISYEVWLFPEPPAACGMAVLKGGKRYPGVLTYREYVQTSKAGDPTGKWRDAPAHQLEKCVEAFCLRRAFPNDLGGLHIEEEIQPAGPDDAPPAAVARLTAADITSQRARPDGEKKPRQRRQSKPEDEPADRPTGAPSATASEEATRPAPPAGPAPAATAPSAERPPARASTGQVGMIQSAFAKLGYEPHDREERLIFTAALAGYDGDLETSGHLTEAQARTALGRLNGIATRFELIQAVNRIENARKAEHDG